MIEQVSEAEKLMKPGDIFTLSGKMNPTKPNKLQDFEVIALTEKGIEFKPKWTRSELAQLNRMRINEARRQRKRSR